MLGYDDDIEEEEELETSETGLEYEGWSGQYILKEIAKTHLELLRPLLQLLLELLLLLLSWLPRT